ncbi:hypothetical protein C0J56_24785 [Pseudomonas fluorescens]|nr:hypothetical protein C0J56_24785 [Pseudomonas fluorescens]
MSRAALPEWSNKSLWRGDLSPLGCEAALKGLRQSTWHSEVKGLGAASQPDGDKSPRHKKILPAPPE